MARQTLMQQLTKFEGSCCVYGYFTEKAEKSAREIARHLGVTPRTIRLYRQRMRDGSITCPFKELGPQENPLTALDKEHGNDALARCLIRSLLSSSASPLSNPEDHLESTSASHKVQSR